ncbi:MAG TPA: hypothetical protein VKU38_24075 [Ktedonobacteraceae bacterium]|nr:hypothetical protein [Ktedonobacteraceae bacterium]
MQGTVKGFASAHPSWLDVVVTWKMEELEHAGTLPGRGYRAYSSGWMEWMGYVEGLNKDEYAG